MKQPDQQISWLGSASIAGLLSWGVIKTWPMLESDMVLVPVILSLVSIVAYSKTIALIIPLLKNLHQHRRAMAPSTNKGSSRWATFEDIKKAALYKQTDGLLLGMDSSGRAVFENSESHGMILAPAGLGKTARFVIPNMLHYRGSIICTDLKHTIACVTKRAREKHLKNKTYCLNPSGKHEDILGKSACYNPVSVIIRAWKEKRYSAVVMLAQKLAAQLLPEPKHAGENDFFRRGSLKLIVFGILYLVTRDDFNKVHLPQLLRLLRNTEKFKDALHVASCSDILNGELADIAADLLPKFESNDTKQVESFREGATQSLEFASPSSEMAESLSSSSFSFKELKEENITVYINEDNKQYLGLIIWAAIEELKSCGNNKRILFMLDECTGFKLYGISEALTGFREFGLKIIFVFQEIAEYERIYGREAKETMLSQTGVKLIMGASGSTAEWLSKELGNTTIKGENFNLGKTLSDPMQCSVNDQHRPLYMPDEVRRCGHGILLIGSLFPIIVDRI